jgi:hypothetical protein
MGEGKGKRKRVKVEGRENLTEFTELTEWGRVSHRGLKSWEAERGRVGRQVRWGGRRYIPLSGVMGWYGR